jgi:hypothetical protein
MNERKCFGIFKFDRDRINVFENLLKPIVEAHTELVYEDARSQYASLDPKISTIFHLIQIAELCIIDLTYKNVNVFFEYGIVFAENKKFIVLCSNANFKSKRPTGFNSKLPFDIEGKEVILYKNENDLRVRFSDALYDVLYKPKNRIIDWYSHNGKNNVVNPHQLIFNEDDQIISSSQLIPSRFRLSYKIKIDESPNNKNPDFRIYISKNNVIHNSILIILPWENSDFKGKYECHVDYQTNEDNGSATRLQQVPVTKKGSLKPLEFTVFISLTLRGLIVESDFFDKEIPRIMVTGKQLRDSGFDTSSDNYLLLSARCKCHINEIVLKEIT